MIPIPYFYVKRELYSLQFERKSLHSDDMVWPRVWCYASSVPEERLEQQDFSVAHGY